MNYFMISHNDLDGIGSPVLGKKVYGNKFDYKCIKYGEEYIIEALLRGILQKSTVPDLTVFICDLNFDDHSIYHLIQEVNDFGVRVLQFDHHPESKNFENKEWMHFSEDVCATVLFYKWLLIEYFHDEVIFPILNEYKQFVKWVNAYDMWKWHTYDADIAKNIRWLNKNVRFKTSPVAVERYVKDANVTIFSKSELINLNKYEIMYQNFVKLIVGGGIEVKTDKLGQSFILIKSSAPVYEATPYIFKTYDIDYILIVDTEKGDVGYRSQCDKGIARKMAMMFGGNGHANASGSKITKEWIEFYS